MIISKLEIIDNPDAGKGNDDKRLIAIFTLDNNKTKKIKFGLYNSKGTFFDINDEVKKKAYIARHKVREDFNNIMTAGALSRWILWESTSKTDIIKLLKNKFNINSVNILFKKYSF